MALQDALVTALGGGGVTGVLAYLGIRYTARKSSEVQRAAIEVDQRKVDREQFEEFKESYREEMTRLTTTVEKQQGIIRSAIRHIRTLRFELARHSIPPPPLPEELETVDFF
ncbi:hypothetical protein [Streptomyces sp. NPDC015131]|uniref:hypothetical protein n=1 Tax=Streptomyces sp. NPDC015131 TaxID=3364941 RepID=UPI0036FC6BAA